MAKTSEPNGDYLGKMVNEAFERLTGARLTVDGLDYILCEKLGVGGQGWAYSANLDGQTEADYVIKLLLDQNVEELDRAFRELKSGDLDHPNLVKPLGIGSNPDKLVGILYERVYGPNLKYLIDTKVPLESNKILRWGIQLAEALAFVHSQGVIHRDVKPSNILIDQATQTLKLTDFGLSVDINDDDSLTRTGGVVGSMAYLSPEGVLTGTVSFQSDIYSTGILLHELVTGNRIRSTKQITVTDRELAKVISCCIQRELRDRYGSAEPVRDDLEAILNGKPAKHARKLLGRKSRRKACKNAALLLLVGLVGVAVLRGFVFPASDSSTPETTESEAAEDSPPKFRLNFRPDAQGYQPFRLLDDDDTPEPVPSYEYVNFMFNMLFDSIHRNAPREEDSIEQEEPAEPSTDSTDTTP